MENYDERLMQILSYQYLEETKIRFKNLRNGDVLKLRPLEDLLSKDCYCAFVKVMDNKRSELDGIVFNILEWDRGYIQRHSLFSLDMFEYDMPKYTVELI